MNLPEQGMSWLQRSAAIILFSIHFKQEDLGSDSDSIHIISLQVLFPFENRAICNHESRTR